MAARTNGPEAIWHNPAGLAGERKSSISGNASAFERTEVRVSGSNTKSVESGINMFPAFVGSSFPITVGDEEEPSLVLGLALATPENWSQTISLFNKQSVGSDTQTVSFESENELSSLVPTAALGWHASDEIDLGISIRVGYSTLNELRTRT